MWVSFPQAFPRVLPSRLVSPDLCLMPPRRFLCLWSTLWDGWSTMYHFSQETSITISLLVSNTDILSTSFKHRIGLFPWFYIGLIVQRSGDNFSWNFASGLEIMKGKLKMETSAQVQVLSLEWPLTSRSQRHLTPTTWRGSSTLPLEGAAHPKTTTSRAPGTFVCQSEPKWLLTIKGGERYSLLLTHSIACSLIHSLTHSHLESWFSAPASVSS